MTSQFHDRAPDSSGIAARSGRRRRGGLLALHTCAFLLLQPVSYAFAFPNPATVNLGTAGAFTVLAATTVTNTGPTVISADAGVGGNLGVSPGTAVTGFPPGVVTPPGTMHAADAVAAQAQNDLTTAYNDLAGRACNSNLTGQDLGGLTLTAGVYCFDTSAQLTGTLTLDGQGNPDAIFIFQIGSTLVTSVGSSVLLINGAQACNVYFQVGSSATLGAGSAFNGNILALVSISVGANTNVQGRLLARTGAVTLDSDTINTPACAPSSGVALAPLLGRAGPGVVLAGFLAGVGLLMLRRRTRLPATR